MLANTITELQKQNSEPNTTQYLSEVQKYLQEKNDVSNFNEFLKKILAKNELPETPCLRSEFTHFFRQVEGVWACSNPSCEHVSPEFQYEGRCCGCFFPLQRSNVAVDLGC